MEADIALPTASTLFHPGRHLKAESTLSTKCSESTVTLPQLKTAKSSYAARSTKGTTTAGKSVSSAQQNVETDDQSELDELAALQKQRQNQKKKQRKRNKKKQEQ